MVWVSLALILLLGLLLLAGVAVYLTFRAIFRPPRMTDGKAMYLLRRLDPGDLGLPYEDVSFRVGGKPDEITLAAWWMPNANHHGRTAILLHGYADAKVGAIAWAPLFYGLGYNVLAVDLRAHGASGGDTLTAGHLERHDVSAAIDQLKAERPGQTRQVVLFGASLGAAVAAQVAAIRDDVAAVILDSPFADFRHAAVAHSNLLGFPGSFVQRLALKLGGWTTGADFEALRPPAAIARIACPVLLVQSEHDPFTTEQDVAVLRAAVEGRAERGTYWLAEDADHLMALHRRDETYWKKVSRFLEECGNPPADAAKANPPINEEAIGVGALCRAAFDGNLELVRDLLDRGVDVDGTSSLGTTPLHDAIENRREDVVRLLLDRGADPNQLDAEGWTPLLHAIDIEVERAEGTGDAPSATMTLLLLDRGADSTAGGPQGQSPYDLAVTRCHRQAAEILAARAGR